MNKIEPKILAGTRDFLPIDMAKRNIVMEKIRNIFERFGYDAIETPILCPAETILGKYGEEGNRLTYNFTDGGGRKIALPYDLTVPFARFVAKNFRELPMPFKRYQIQRVWRAEKPQKGRLREFYQCDIDIIGTKSLICEAEIAKVIVVVFEGLGFKNFTIKFNSRRIINAILESFGVAKEKIIEAIRIIDKIAKIGDNNVIEELRELGIERAEEILSLLKPGNNIEDTLAKISNYDTTEIKDFSAYCSAIGIPEKYLQFDPSLARGLDYYTGIIYEVVSSEADFGTLCAGGRYDNLCQLFCDEDFSGVGVAFGFERLMLVLEKTDFFKEMELNSKALVTLFDENLEQDALNTYAILTSAGINSEIYFQPDRLKKQFAYADKKSIPFVIVRGSDEVSKEEVTIKSMKSGKQKTIPINQLTTYLSNYEKTK
jgi:histidyl-tRNA synthetase